MISRLPAIIIRQSLLPVISLLISITCKCQTYIGLREIVSYGKQQYNAGAQNWDIRQDVKGRMYFANNEGLLSFDGTYWKLYPLQNKTIVRSIEFGADNRIYAGGQDELGYFSPNETGKLVYTSLKNLLPETDRSFADIWDIAVYDKGVFFRSGSHIFQYRDNKIKVFKPSSSWAFMGLNHDQLIAQDIQKGVLMFKNGDWVPFIEKNLLPEGFDITDIASLNKNSCVVTSRENGIYLLTDGKLVPFKYSGMPIEPYQNFSGAARIDDEHFIVGTYTNGFYLIDVNGVVVENFSKKEGLQNSNVRSLFCDKNNNIWLGLDSGVDFVAFNNAIKHINPVVMNDGAGYAVSIYQNSIYFGLSNGIFQLPLEDVEDLSYLRSNFKFVIGGQTWGLSIINDKLLAGKDEGFFQVNGTTASVIMKNTGYWTFQALQSIHQLPIIVAGNYHGIRLFESVNNQYIDKGTPVQFVEPARYVVIDNNNVIWVSHPYRGIYKIQLSATTGNTIKLYTAANGLPSTLNNHVYKVKNRVLIATEKGIYEYNMQSDQFEPSAYYKDILGEQGTRYLKEDPNGNIWFVQEKNIGVVDFSTSTPTVIYLPELKGKIMSGFEHIYPVNDNNIFVGGEKGFYHINYKKYKQNTHALNVYIRTVKAIGKKEMVLFDGYFGNVNDDTALTTNNSPTVSHQWNSFHIEYSSPLFEQQSNIEYSYYLEGFDKGWSVWSKKTEKDYTNLPAGTYSFQVKARNNLHSESRISSFSFTVSPPWYQTTMAYVLYSLLLLALVFFLYKKQQKRLVRERLKHQEEQKRTVYLHQLELEKSEKELVKLKNEKLESEIEFKNTELATTAMHLVQKEEFLIKIKEEIQHLNKNGKDKTDPAEIKKILRILSEEEKLDEEWEQFSLHFDNVHGNFLVKLKEKYPSLKPHELKLCAYLRMNMSSKEIARLMSISVRGVEISRYRLRKKLELPTETNLFQFLFDLQKNDLNT